VRLWNLHDELWDRRLGVRTFGFHAGSGEWGSPDWNGHYKPLAYSELFGAFKAAGLTHDDVLTDLGCGMGRALFAASFAGVGKAVGVELVPELARAAEANLRRSRLSGRNIEVVHGNALDYSFHETTAMYLFHSFSGEILRQVLANARMQRPAGRRFRVIYANPVFESVLSEAGWLHRLDLLPPNPGPLSREKGYATAIWGSVD
jgi:SAM-dependent methyltransferase